MKNLLMIAIAFLTISASAQERKKEDHNGDMKDRKHLRQELSPEETAKLQTKRMTLNLDLTEKQQVEVEKVLLAEAKTRKAKIEAFKAKKDNVEGERPSKEDRVKMANERLDHQIEMKGKMKAILNAEQYGKFEKMQEKQQSKKGKSKKTKMHKD